MAEINPGLYDELVTELLQQRLAGLRARRLGAAVDGVEPAELPERVAELAGRWVRQAIAAVGSDQRAEVAVGLADSLLEAIGRIDTAVAGGQRLAEPVERLAAVEPLAPTGTPITIRRPLTPLRDTVLMTNARDQPAVGREIAAEIDSADRIEVVLAFIRWTGIRDLLAALERHVQRGRPLRVITTTYTGSTELRALQALVDVGAEVKVSYDVSTTRLHAKAWLFGRDSGFSTVYIGSSNLTFSAQVTGLEWNVRASERSNPELIAAFERTFATYWADPHFEPFEPEAFARAVAAAGGAAGGKVVLTPFRIEPYPFQRQILERLAVERRRGHHHNLVVAATGTGKTIIAALDYRRLRAELARARLLFVAHRSEILDQSRTTFRHVLRDGSFGERWVAGDRPTRWEHVFASIQSLSAGDVRNVDPEHFDVVIVDEFHHAAAASYAALLDHVRPRHLLGLTATPERADGLDVLGWFGGRIAVELRLWDALEQGLLAPFHYFGVHDATDLSRVTWRRGTGYDTGELTALYTADDVWAGKVIAEVRRKVGDPRRMRALAFCVSIEHARFMAHRFQRAGLEARAVTSRTAEAERRQALDDLRAGRVQVLCTVDLFNEGVDVPAVDVVLMLRPTESATVFLQQLGRGLRHAEGKDVLTVLDFVGHQAKAFRFDLRYRRLLGRTRRELEADIEHDFPFLPAGCHLELDPVARQIVLDNVRHALPTTWNQRVQELRQLGDVDLATFLHESGLERDDLYRGGRTWSELRRAAGLPAPPAGPDEAKLGRGIARLLHLDDEERIAAYRQLVGSAGPPRGGDLDERTRRQLEGLLLVLLGPRKGTYPSLDAAAEHLWHHPAVRAEMAELLPLLEDQVQHLHQPLGLLQPVPLQVHAHYSREEVLAAFGASTVVAPLPLQTGVFWHEPTSTDLLFITLQKTERDYSPTTRYLDYAISDQLFHWETQASTAADSERAKAYVHHAERGRHVALFIRSSKRDATGRTLPYFCAGLASYVEHRGDRPVQITWRLHHRLPGDVFSAFRATVA
jgi:superfamily II DNA or RNA helicase/HKD family nuclease